jgi:putative acetyltransferase
MQLHPEVLPLRDASREMIRELGFLQSGYLPAGVTHSACHAMIEVGERPGLTQLGLAERLRLDKSTTSRVVKALVGKGWVRARRDGEDARRASLELTPAGRAKLEQIHRCANAQVQGALEVLSEEERRKALDGIRTYARALARARARSRYRIRPIKPGDDAAMARIIRQVMPEYGASGPGYAINDPEVNHMSATYGRPRSAYFVLVDGERVVGGGGVARLAGADPGTCELRKMYFLPEVRGLGFGQEMIDRCLDAAHSQGFERCYLETLKNMTAARALYQKNGFRPRAKPLGDTGHFGCDAWYERSLRRPRVTV